MSEKELGFTVLGYWLLIFITANHASRVMNRSFWTWFGLSLLVSPIVAFPLLLLFGPEPKKADPHPQVDPKYPQLPPPSPPPPPSSS
jgi:hypothetical protein